MISTMNCYRVALAISIIASGCANEPPVLRLLEQSGYDFTHGCPDTGELPADWNSVALPSEAGSARVPSGSIPVSDSTYDGIQVRVWRIPEQIHLSATVTPEPTDPFPFAAGEGVQKHMLCFDTVGGQPVAMEVGYSESTHLPGQYVSALWQIGEDAGWLRVQAASADSSDLPRLLQLVGSVDVQVPGAIESQIGGS